MFWLIFCWLRAQLTFGQIFFFKGLPSIMTYKRWSLVIEEVVNEGPEKNESKDSLRIRATFRLMSLIVSFLLCSLSPSPFCSLHVLYWQTFAFNVEPFLGVLPFNDTIGSIIRENSLQSLPYSQTQTHMWWDKRELVGGQSSVWSLAEIRTSEPKVIAN